MKSFYRIQGQRGLSLIETMVGIIVGLLTVLAAVGTLMVTRQGSTTVSESYRMSSAGNAAMRLIAATIRQGGAAELVQPVAGGPVSFGDMDLRAAGAGGDQIVTGTEGASGAADTLTVSYQHKNDDVTRDCLGNSPGAAGVRTDNAFAVNGVELQCNNQALVGDEDDPGRQIDVENFQVWYWVINAAGQQRRVTATDVPGNGDWLAVDAVEVCLQLRGIATNYPTANFTNCNGASVANGGRLHQVFRGVYKLRNRV